MARTRTEAPRLYLKRGWYYLTWWHATENGGVGRRMQEALKTQDPSEAKRRLDAKIVEQGKERLGLSPAAGLAGQAKATVADCLNLLEADYLAQKNKSWATMRYHVRAMGAALGGLRVADLTTARVRNVRLGWTKAGIAEATCNNRLAMLNRALAVALDLDVIAYRPKVKIEFPKPKNARQGFFEIDQFRRFEPKLGARDLDVRDAVEWGFYTGWRVSEVEALQWSALTRDGGTWELRLPDSKSGEARLIPVVGPLRAIMERRLARRVLGSPWIFSRRSFTPDGAKRAAGQRLGDVRKVWRAAWVAAGLPMVTRTVRPRPGHPVREVTVPALSFHDLRRSAVRNMTNAGVPEKVAMLITGHKTREMYRRYQINRTDDLAAAILATARHTGAKAGRRPRPTVRALPGQGTAAARV